MPTEGMIENFSQIVTITADETSEPFSKVKEHPQTTQTASSFKDFIRTDI